MKRRLFAVLLAATMLMSTLTVSAEDKNLTSDDPAGTTAVEAEILEEDSGDVTYIIAIPEKIDFGTLVMPENDEEAHLKTVGFNVSAVEINGLVESSQIAVLLKDANTETETFTIYGISDTNAEKSLDYTVHNVAGTNIASGTMYVNGFAFAVFSQAGQSVEGSLQLEQNQLLADTEIANWAGDYLGTINFFTKIVGMNEYN